MMSKLQSSCCALARITLTFAMLGVLRGAQAQVIPPDPGGPHEPPGRRPPRGRATMPDDGTCRACVFPPDFIAPVPQAACWHLVDGLENGGDCDLVQIPFNQGRR